MATRAGGSAGSSKPSKASAPPRAWQRMLSGRRLDLLDPSPLDVEIEDIAHGLARVARWNGQTDGAHAFTVAEHCVMVCDLTTALKPQWPAKWQLASLLHDAPEYVIGDMISPFKAALGVDYRAFEDKLAAAIHTRFGLPAHLPKSIEETIKRADRAAAYFEAIDIAGFSEQEANEVFGRPRGVPRVEVQPLPTGKAQALFLERFATLCDRDG